ncbi:MAG: hypothetical protein ACOC71_05500, partial [Hyphomicrobiales bacterium]
MSEAAIRPGAQAWAWLTRRRPGRVRVRLSRDDWYMRALIGVIGLYLVVTLALPLYAMLSKSFSTYQFDLTAYAFQVDEGSGWGPV